MNVDVNEGVILGWASLDWSIIVDNVLGDHTGNPLVAAVEPVGASGHDSGGLSTFFLEHGEVGWDIELDITAAASIAPLDHGEHALI
jgi:hypothetical protein